MSCNCKIHRKIKRRIRRTKRKLKVTKWFLKYYWKPKKQRIEEELRSIKKTIVLYKASVREDKATIKEGEDLFKWPE